MTERTSPAPGLVRPEPDSRLEQLAARYDAAKDRADEAKAELDELAAALKNELAAAAPGRDRVVLESPHLRTPLRMAAVGSWRFDAPRFKRDHPELYVRYANRSTAWRLEREK